MENTIDVKRWSPNSQQNQFSVPWKHKQYFKTEHVLKNDEKNPALLVGGKFSRSF